MCQPVGPSYEVERGITVSVDSPYCGSMKVNLARPAVLREHFGMMSAPSEDPSYVKVQTYGNGSGSLSVGIPPW